MATPTVKDLSETLLPIQLKIDDRNYKLLVKGSDLAFLSDNMKEITKDLKTCLPEVVPINPIYITFQNGRVVLPKVIFKGTGGTVATKASEANPGPSTSSNISHDHDDTTSRQPLDDPPEPVNPVEDTSSPDESSRFEWKFAYTKHLLAVLKSKKEKDTTFSKNIWGTVAEELKIRLGNVKRHPNLEQCREKFYTLRRAYRKFLSESKKTGNKRPKPFIHEVEMYDLLHDDPAINPPVLKSSLGFEDFNNNDNSTANDEDEEEAPTSSKVPKVQKKGNNKNDELVEYLKERDDKFLNAIEEMRKSSNSYLEKLIEKL